MERGKEYHAFNYEEDHLDAKSKGRNKGVDMVRRTPRIQQISYDTLWFGFTKLTSTGGLYPEVQQKLINRGVIEKTGPIRRRSIWKYY